MAALTTIARPYAVAAFAVARKDADGGPARWSRSLAALAEICAYPEVGRRLADPGTSAQAKADLLVSLLGEELGQPVQAFVKTLTVNKRLALLPEIHTLFEQYKANLESTLDVVVETAFALDDAQRMALQTRLSRRFDRDVILIEEVNPELIGGVVIRTGDRVIDRSVRGRLQQLAEELLAA